MGKKKVSINEALDNQGKIKKAVISSWESSSNGGLRKTTSIIALAPILVILLVSFAVYVNSFSGNFVYDDNKQIVENPWIRDVNNIPTIFSKSVWSFRPRLSTSNYYRPLMHVVYMLNYHIFGLKPWGYHLVNVLFHCGVVVLVFLIIQELMKGQRATKSLVYLSPPLMAAMLFASHPIHTEAVTWIAGLPDVAFALFYLLSFYCFMLFRGGTKRVFPLSILSFSVSLLFKEPALTLPFMLIAYDSLFKKWDKTILSSIKTYSPYIVVSAGYLFMRYYALRSFAPIASYPDLSTYQFVINVFPLFREYITSLLWPFYLNMWHTFHPISSLVEAKGAISLVVTVMFFISAVAAYRKNRVVLFGLLFFVVPLLPVFYIKGISGKPFAERYLYLPSVGFVLLLAIFLSWASEKLPRAAKGITIVIMIIVGVYSIGTVSRNTVWKDNFSLWSDTVKKSPDIADAHNNLGDAYASKGQWEMAMTEFQAALRLDPNDADAHNNLGLAYASKGLPDMAITEYQTALNLKPDYAKAHDNLGLAYASKGLPDMAITEYQTALNLNPDYAKAHDNLGLAYASKGQWEMAMTEFQAALRLDPDHADAHNNLGASYWSKGFLDMAITEFQAALRLNPDHAKAHNNLGLAYASKGLPDMAITEYQTALNLKPDYVEAHYNLAITYLRKGNADLARREVEVLLNIRPDFNAGRQLLNEIKSRR